DTFRKKLFIGGGVGVALVVFLVWAFVFAPRATVTITAKTNAVNISEPITLDPNATTAIEEGRIKPIIKQIKKTTSAEFDTTGTKEIGNKATGSMTLSNSGESDPIVVEAGTVFKSPSGQEFTSNSSVTVPGFRRSGGRDIPGTATVNVTASAIGGEYNLPSQSYATRAPVAAQGSQMSGGNRETVNVVAQADVDKAQQGLSAQNEEDVKRELRAQFGKDDIVIQESFKADVGSPTVSPAVGEQAKRARLSVETTYTVIGAPRNDVKGLLAGVLKDEIGDRNDRRIYSDGDKSISFSQFQAAQNGTFTAQLSTTGYIGPTIDDKRLAERIAGKRYGEIEQTITPIEGIEDVDIQFSPFWVNKAPKKTDKIAIKFSVKNDTN
ncbi:hypothetical protein CYG49_03500, partial [Candidatus Saccharibacteria bacterium]